MSKPLYLGKASLSKQETIEAWKLERLEGKTRVTAAMRFNVSEKTLYRMYKKYGLPSPKRKAKKDPLQSE